MDFKFTHIQPTDNGLFHYNSGIKDWDREEVTRANQSYYENEEKCVQEILQDGFVEFPIMFDQGEDNIQWSCCWLPPSFEPSCSEGYKERHGHNFNIYIPSYKRAGITLTDKMLDELNVTNYYFCIDPSQYSAYKKAYGKDKLIIRDYTFRNPSKTNLNSSLYAPDTLAGGSAFMNAIIWMSKSLGEKGFWMLDDDLPGLGIKCVKNLENTQQKGYQYNKDDYYRCSHLRPDLFDLNKFMSDMETLFFKCRNASMFSLDKFGLAFGSNLKLKRGTRSYTFILFKNKVIERPEEGIQNNDISMSLVLAKAGYINMIMTSPTYISVDTQQVAGGCTDAYKTFGTLDKAKVLVNGMPNYTKISNVYSRIHHRCDFSQWTDCRFVGEVIE